MIPLTWNVQNRHIHRERKFRFVVASSKGWWEWKGRWQFLFEVIKMFGIRYWWWLSNIVNILKAELNLLKIANFMLCKIRFNLKKVTPMPQWDHVAKGDDVWGTECGWSAASRCLGTWHRGCMQRVSVTPSLQGRAGSLSLFPTSKPPPVFIAAFALPAWGLLMKRAGCVTSAQKRVQNI